MLITRPLYLLYTYKHWRHVAGLQRIKQNCCKHTKSEEKKKTYNGKHKQIKINVKIKEGKTFKVLSKGSNEKSRFMQKLKMAT